MPIPHKKPLALSVEIDGYQEDAIVAQSLKETFASLKSDKHEWPDDRDAMIKSLKCIYHYYTGKILK